MNGPFAVRGTPAPSRFSEKEKTGCPKRQLVFMRDSGASAGVRAATASPVRGA
jgi:hypothetical protein